MKDTGVPDAEKAEAATNKYGTASANGILPGTGKSQFIFFGVGTGTCEGE
jgi:hypothetical protein